VAPRGNPINKYGGNTEKEGLEIPNILQKQKTTKKTARPTRIEKMPGDFLTIEKITFFLSEKSAVMLLAAGLGTEGV
jgi:hypothetical protein